MRPSSFSRGAGFLAVLAVPFFVSQGLAAQSPIAIGDLVVVRVGSGASVLSNASQAVYLDEYTAAGAPVQSLPMPIAASGTSHALTMSGTATSEGDLNMSVDGRYLLLTGYDTPPGTAGVASTGTGGASPVLRVVGRVDLNANIDTTTAITAYSGNNIRSAASLAGNDFWTAGASNSINYIPAIGGTAFTQLTLSPSTIRTVRLFAGQLYCSTASGSFQGVSTVGTGLPTTSGQSLTILPGFPTTAGPSSYGFWFADQSTVYVADDRASAFGGIQKWTFSGGTWNLAYTLNPLPAVGCRGLCGVVIAGTATLFATTSEPASTLNHIVTVTDTGAASTFTTLATAPTNTVFRGIRIALPGPIVTPYGSGCAGTGGYTPILSTSQVPYFGNAGFSMDVTSAAPSAPAAIYGSVGTDPTGTPIAGSCTAYLDIASALSLISAGIFPLNGATDGLGNASIPLPIPYAPFLAGVHVGLQAIVIDGGSPTGFTLTNALDMLLDN